MTETPAEYSDQPWDDAALARLQAAIDEPEEWYRGKIEAPELCSCFWNVFSEDGITFRYQHGDNPEQSMSFSETPRNVERDALYISANPHGAFAVSTVLADWMRATATYAHARE